MKKLLIYAVLLLLPLVASARENEPVLAPDGALFFVHEQQRADDTADAELTATQYLVLETRRGSDTASQIIPATKTKGAHGSAAMAYDSGSKTLFVFWLHDTGTTSSELLFASLDSDGVWSEATAFGMPYNVRQNLRIAVTRKMVQKSEDGSPDKLVSGLSVHAVWWEFDSQRVGGFWSAQYALLSIEDGKVDEIEFFDLSSVVEGEKAADAGSDVPEDSVLRHPQLFPTASQDSVMVLFGDVNTNKLHQARIFPVKAEGRLRVPVGRRETGGLPGPRINVTANSTMGTIFADVDRIAYYVREGDKLHYSILRDNACTDPQNISLDEQMTSSAAVDAIRRHLNH